MRNLYLEFFYCHPVVYNVWVDVAVLSQAPFGSHNDPCSCGFSMKIELVQFVFGLGLCETDDVIFNTLGAAFGTLAFVCSRRLKKTNS